MSEVQEQPFPKNGHRDSDIDTYHHIIASPDHRIIISQSTQTEKKRQFCYHYAQNKTFMLGQGSYGRIYICYYQNKQTGRIYKLALKIISIPNSIQEIKKIDEIVAFTRQEVKSLIKLRHNPNIIKIQDVVGDTKNHRIYLILEYCNNKDLDNYFRILYHQGRIRKQEDILRYFKQILNAFKDLYKLNIIHRDIKPQNILVNNGVLKIADFGLSKQLFEKTEAFYEEHYGTFVTASPQIRFKERYTNKCDIYSLGVTLYWMIYLSFPFKNQFSKDEFLKMSLKFQHEVPSSSMKISNELVELIRSMLEYTQEARINWHELFNHPIFDKIKEDQDEEGVVFRTTIGRDIQNQYSSKILDNTIPKEFYLYILNSSNNFDLTSFPSRNFQEDPVIKTFMPIFLEVLNQKFKINFLKEVLRETYEFKMSDRIKNKMEFAIMKDLIRYGLEKYIVYLMKKIKDELQGTSICEILDTKVLNSVSNMKEYSNFVKNYVLEVENYQKSNKKPKMSEQQRQTLKKRCKEYQIYGLYEHYLQKPILFQQQFLLKMKSCFIEVIYFIKDQVKFYSSKQNNLADIQQKRYRELILLIHHYYMIVLMKDMFPNRYTDSIDYDFQKFNQKEKYPQLAAFLKLAEGINEILDCFEN